WLTNLTQPPDKKSGYECWKPGSENDRQRKEREAYVGYDNEWFPANTVGDSRGRQIDQHRRRHLNSNQKAILRGINVEHVCDVQNDENIRQACAQADNNVGNEQSLQGVVK